MKRIPLDSGILRLLWIMLLVGLLLIVIKMLFSNRNHIREREKKSATLWIAPDTGSIPHTVDGAMIRYGRDLIVHTSVYLGPKGKIVAISNGMNCQNCHLDAGTKLWGNNYSSTASTYPKFRARSGTVESIGKKVNDCLIRSLNGNALDSNSLELRAIIAYIHWLGKGVPKGYKPPGSGIKEMIYLERAADTAKGKLVFEQKCGKCHGENGAGKLKAGSTEYEYPPLWGEKSYNTGAGIYRISKLAGYIKNNMPFGIDFKSTQLTDDEAWDVAAFVNSQPRPFKAFPADWPDINTKPEDLPFGPFSDTFSAQQHKYGPFGPILHQRGKGQIK
ncbi:thiosulfate dehydrogenase [Chitinophaga niastensis]|uniref:Thiosulfate dehydrogenase n=1 Tax=Chitinophaga niastensis TaxID=536980 RepID=A0A2P8HST5_CHINA|nr:c-type cytochrome [Chitinophaga niastensis]PSL49289.1 thiosulfate dehydrogenase [Chitinophaga niastensis]